MAEPFIGQIMMFGGNFAPRGWALCDGTLLPIAQNTALFSILGTLYGGDGRTTFALPDLRGRVAMHEGTGPGLSPKALGQKSGAETNTLNANQLPSHTHTATTTTNCVVGSGNSNVASGNYWSKDFGSQSGTYNSGPADGTMADGAVTTTVAHIGSSQPVNNMQPFQVINYIIALQGLFPSRN